MASDTQKPADVSWDSWNYRIGCPVWNCKHWDGEIYPLKSHASQSLQWYSRAFNTVEGNSTFYALPDLSIVKKWCQQTADGFCFSMKFPRQISHDAKLVDIATPLGRFVDLLNLLRDHDRLGPTFLQLGPDFSSRYWDRLRSFLDNLSGNFPLAIEFRHPDWFDEDQWESEVDELLIAHKVDRVLFDARALYSRQAEDEAEVKAQGRKPRSPLRTTVTANSPFVRIIGLNQVEEVDPWWQEWAETVAGWIEQGLTPWVFTHAPDDQYAPRLARRFHELVKSRLPSIPSLPSPPSKPQRPTMTQPFLFD